VNELKAFLIRYQDEVLENQRILALDITLKETPVRWWGEHKEIVKDWYQCKRLLRIRFGAEDGTNQLQKMTDRGTSRPLGEVHNTMEDDITRGVASSFCSHIIRDSNKLVYRLVIAQRNYKLDSVTTKLYSHFLI
jgi:hypothetical protein